ncbi:MAG TPA: tetratricopeptide repeat protein [Pirellulales bacterium]|nr:tetratricopeptide repeat protein [Pirellulales bacterium]
MARSASSTITRPAERPSISLLGKRAASEGVDRLLEEFERRWSSGEKPTVEEYLERHPELNERPETVIELLYEELCQRRQAGEAVSDESLYARFPQWRSQLELLLDCQRLLEDGAGLTTFPSVGERLGDFVFLAELGRGAHGRVFLATQPSLANRPIVLKLAPPRGSEHLCLARLQHTHIVPLYSVTDFPERGLRGICLPYFGGATLSRVLESLAARSPVHRKAQDLVAIVERTADELPATVSDLPAKNAPPALKFLERTTYVQAVCWMGACLADALHEAHARGLVHLDLKPSNVLWAGDGQPMLLDFHLAREPLAAGQPAPDWLGGTPGYMPPEQAAALEAVRGDALLSSAVDGRADIYALGRVLAEALAGKLPPEAEPAADWLRRENPSVSVGLGDLIAKCLSAKPEERYANAAELASDLRRHLENLPLAAVKNRSLTERWFKWRRRRPHALLVFLLAVAAVGAAALVATQLYKQYGQAALALEEGRKLIDEHRYAEAHGTLRQGLNLAAPIYSGSGLWHQLSVELRIAEHAQAGRELHEYVEKTRVLFSGESWNESGLRQLESQARYFWDRRQQLFDQSRSSANYELARRLRSDLLELTILWTGLRVKLAEPEKKEEAHRQALSLLAEVESLAGESCAVWYARQTHAAALGMEEYAEKARREAEAMPPRNAWESAAAGRALWEAGRKEEARALFEAAIQDEPQSLWANLCLGRCDSDLGRYAEAANSFTACVALAPNSAWCFQNRGQALLRLGKLEQARQDFDRALRLDPLSVGTRIVRGRINLQQQRWDEALADFQEVLDRGSDAATAYAGLAAACAGRGDQAAAQENLEKALAADPENPEALSLQKSWSENAP